MPLYRLIHLYVPHPPIVCSIKSGEGVEVVLGTSGKVVACGSPADAGSCSLTGESQAVVYCYTGSFNRKVNRLCIQHILVSGG